LIAPGAYEIARAPGRNAGDIVADVFSVYSGYNIKDGSFDWGRLAQGWGPFVTTCLATYGVPKLMGIIRRL